MGTDGSSSTVRNKQDKKTPEERVFSALAKELHKVAPSLTIYHFHEEIHNPWTRELIDCGWVWVVGGRRYSEAKPAILDMMVAFSKAKVKLPDVLHQRIISLYGKKGS